ncbi:SGNH/GDSL hydrolase family protein [Mycolicibacterium komossense]|uniref:SGNH/GDSL hydrolase family protein n=2 Tax=Mycolicibacterium komossense TaxID=1779 RepID=A0ABT3CLP5_9MYCO|nr:SGNH/GDSL hydrolase family protein [Mycolicibacterium komossense]
MAAGPGIPPRVAGSPFRAARSARNYPHLIARVLELDLVDVTYSGATTLNLLDEPQNGTPPQIDTLDGTESLVTITIGGNDVGYVPALMAAALPRAVRRLPLVGPRIRSALDPVARDQALSLVGDALSTVGNEVRRRAPLARVVFVDYLTLLPPADTPAPPLTAEEADLGRHIADELAEITASVAAETGCEIARASRASRDHHAWSTEPWAEGAGSAVAALLNRGPAPFHPNAAGMRAVADLVVELLRPDQ